jgi:hypothetical protein
MDFPPANLLVLSHFQENRLPLFLEMLGGRENRLQL